MTELALLGLGNLGQAMAERLLNAGYRLTLWNRTAGRGEALIEAGARRAEHPREAAASAGGVAITVVSDDAALEAVCLGEDGLLAGLGNGGLHISMSTVSPALARSLAARHQERGVDYVAAPVFGRPAAALAGKLWVCLSGDGAATARAREVLEPLAAGFYEFGAGDAGAANVAKLTGNFLIVAALQAMGEAWAFAEKNGLDREAVAGMFGETVFNCPVYANYGGAIARHAYEPAGFKLSLGLKDVNLLREASETAAVPMPLASLLHDRLLTMVATGRGDLDWGGLGQLAADEAGLTPR